MGRPPWLPFKTVPYGTHYVQEAITGQMAHGRFPKGRDINTADRYCKQALETS